MIRIWVFAMSAHRLCLKQERGSVLCQSLLWSPSGMFSVVRDVDLGGLKSP